MDRYLNINQTERKRTSIDRITACCVVLVIIHNIMPVVGQFISTYISTYFMLMVEAVVWWLLIKWNNGSWIISVFSLFFIAVIQFIYEYIYRYTGLVSGGYGLMYNLSLVGIGILYYDLNRSIRRIIHFSIVASILITIATTIIGSYRFGSGIVRYAASVGSSSDAVFVLTNWHNVGSFSFVYMCLVLYPVLIYYCKVKKVRLLFRIGIIVGVLFFFYRSEFATALLACVACSVLWLIPLETKFRTKILIVLSVAGVLFLCKNLFANIAYRIAYSINSSVLMERFLYIGDTLSGVQNDVFAVGERRKVLEKSLSTIMHHPIIGTLFYRDKGVGGHSYVLDFIARYGLLGWYLLITSYKQIYKNFTTHFSDEYKRQYLIISILLAIALSVVNTGDHWFELVLVIPVLFYNINVKESQRKMV